MFVIVIMFFAALTFNRCKVWENGGTLWTDVINKYPGQTFLPYVNRGDYYNTIGIQEKALTDYNKAIAMDPKQPTFYFKRAIVNESTKDYRSAISDYELALKLDPKDAGIYQNLGVLYSLEKDFDSAIDISLKGLSCDPGNAGLHSNIGHYYIEKENYEQALDNFQKSLKAEPDNFDATIGLSIAYYSKGEKSTAKQYLQKAGNIDPRIKNGMEGLYELEKSGSSYSDKEKEILKEMFAEFRK